MLGIKEKLSLQKTVKHGIDKLKAGIADIRLRLTTQKESKEALDKLSGNSSSKKETLLERFLAGEFTKEQPLKMLSIFQKVYTLAKGELEPLKDAILKFLDWHNSQGHNRMSAGVMESANLLPFEFGNEQAMGQLLDFLRSGRKGSVTISVG